jgi:protein phosphatase
MALVLRYAIRSHVGLIREGNEDSGYAGPRLLAIADGMGGAAAGELASAVVMATVARLDAPGEQPGGADLSATGEQPVPGSGAHPPGGPQSGAPSAPGVSAAEETLHLSQHDIAAHENGPHAAADPTLGEPDLALLGGAVVAANERLRAIVAERPELEGMGTTLTAMLWSGGRFGMVHVGDSRAYRLRDGLLEQMTADHTWVQRLIDEGRITEEEAGHHPQRSLLMRVLDGRTQVEADIGTFDAYAGDRYLLCSDGLSGFVSQETLAETLAAYQDPQQAVDALIELALRAGGPDNITCIVADTLDDGVIPGASPNEATQMLGSVTPVVVGAASEGVERLPRFQTPATGGGQGGQGGPGQGGSGGGQQDEFPQNPAGRAARLRSRRNQQHQQHQQAAAVEQHPGGPLATAPPHYDPSAQNFDAGTQNFDPAAQHFDPAAQTTELDSVPGQRGPGAGGDGMPPAGPPPGAPGSGRRRGAESAFGPDGQPLGLGGSGAQNGPDAKRSKKGLFIGGAVVLVLAGAAVGTYLYSQGQYYVKPSSDGRQVLLYQGSTQLSFLASQVTLSEGPLWINSVPTDKRADLTKTVTFNSKDAAVAYLEQYRKAAKSCADFRHGVASSQSQAKDAAKQLEPSVPTTVESKGGAQIGGDPNQTVPSNGGAPAPPADTATTPPAAGSSTATGDPQSPNTQTSNPQPSAPATTPPAGGESQMQAYCAGTTDGPQ